MNDVRFEARKTLTSFARRGLLILAAALGVATGCASDPTELIVTVSLDGTPSSPITSVTLTLTGAADTIQRKFATLGTVAPDADVAEFTFPREIHYLISDSAIAGPVTVTVDGTDDPLPQPMVLATGTGPAVVEYHKTTAASVTITAVAAPDPAPPTDPATP